MPSSLRNTNQPDLRELLEDGQRLLVTNLLDKLKTGEITHQELAILQKELNRNGVFLKQDDDDDARRVAEKHAANLPDNFDLDNELDDEGA